MNFMTIASGSSGNCTFVGTDKTSILVDVGITRKRIAEGLNSIDLKLDDISGILITHEHIDHIRALGVISRNLGLPIYATKATCAAILSTKELGDMDHTLFNYIDIDVPFNIGDICMTAHSIWHDAVDPVCYTVDADDKKISIATDLGDYDNYLISSLLDSDIIHIEANHDIRMLEVGPYPYHLKQRILSKRGHLSNEASGRLIKSILNDHIKHISLGHLSKENNYPDLAYEAVKNELLNNDFSNDVRDFDLTVSKRDECGPLIYV